MATDADIVNRALQLVGGFNNTQGVTGSPPTFDNSAAGVAAGTLYTSVIQTVGRQFGWDFSRNIATLALTENVPPFGYSYEYSYPSSGIQLRQIVPATIDQNNPVPVRWDVGNTIVGVTVATGSIFFPANPSPGDTVTLNGVLWTFVASGATGNQINIQATAGLTIGVVFASILNASSDPALSVATYGVTGGPATITLTFAYKTKGTAGNAYTLAASAATRSGPTLTGGTSTQQKVIWTNIQDALGTITNQPAVSTWDPLFTESVVRLLASELALALSGKPETSQAQVDLAGAFEKAGEQRVDA